MDFASIRIITADVTRLVGFYEQVTGVAAAWATPDFAELVTPRATVAIGSTRTVGLFADGAAEAAANRTVILEFRWDDVDEAYARLAAEESATGQLDVVQPPTTMPWGNRSLLLRDPDGNLVNLFAPVTPEAIARFAGR